MRRAELKERAKHDKAARDEMIRTMYDISLSAEDPNFSICSSAEINQMFNRAGARPVDRGRASGLMVVIIKN